MDEYYSQRKRNNNYTESQSGETQDKTLWARENRRKLQGLCMIVLLLMCSALFLVFHAKNPEKADFEQRQKYVPASGGDVCDLEEIASAEQYDQIVQRMTDGEFFVLQMNLTASIDSQTGLGIFQVVNAVDNSNPISVTLYLNDDVLYESGAIYPGQYVDAIHAAYIPDPGIYIATAIISVYDGDTKLHVAQTETQLVVVVT